MRVNLVPHCPPERPLSSANVQPADCPFMSNMDEISYWVYTKRAPCLFNYDNVVKKQIEQAHCSKTKPASVCEEVPSPKKKKRKLKILDDDSASTEKQQNIFFENPKCEKQKIASSCKSVAIASNVDFNIKNSPQPNTTKRTKLQRNCQTAQKKNKLVTSTPKPTNLRRSLRKAQQNHNNSLLDNSFEVDDSGFTNGNRVNKQNQQVQQSGNPSHHTKGKTLVTKEKNSIVLNGQFDDLSDVSGFTANYIRSTKIHSKTPRKLKNRSSRNLMKDTKLNITTKNEKMLMCVNKSMNTQQTETIVLNCSTDSSQNVINLVSVKDNEKADKIDKGTSLLKFMNSKLDFGNASNNKINEQAGKKNLDIFQSKNSGRSRYPRRQRNNTVGDLDQNCSKINSTVNSLTTRHSAQKNNKSNNSDKKENTEDKIMSRTRSGRKLGSKLEHDESGCSGVHLNDSSEPISSSVALNVASPSKRCRKTNNTTVRCLRSKRCRDTSGQEVNKDSVSDKSDKKNVDKAQSSAVHSSTPRCFGRVKKSIDKSGQSLRRDSLRDKSGFAACFSDSDSDSEPLNRRKFFC